jgi:hypothetical protein
MRVARHNLRLPCRSGQHTPISRKQAHLSSWACAAGSPGFQPAVSRISKPAQRAGLMLFCSAAIVITGSLPTGRRRYSRLEVCATKRRSGEQARPCALQLAPSPNAPANATGSGEDAGMWSAGAPTTTRETEQHTGVVALPNLSAWSQEKLEGLSAMPQSSRVGQDSSSRNSISWGKSHGSTELPYLWRLSLSYQFILQCSNCGQALSITRYAGAGMGAAGSGSPRGRAAGRGTNSSIWRHSSEKSLLTSPLRQSVIEPTASGYLLVRVRKLNLGW